jgi:hypothetical protein
MESPTSVRSVWRVTDVDVGNDPSLVDDPERRDRIGARISDSAWAAPILRDKVLGKGRAAHHVGKTFSTGCAALGDRDKGSNHGAGQQS